MPAGADRTGAQTRQAIIETAARIFWAKGYESATLGEIADELDITRSAVLHHFDSKATLLGEVMEPLVVAIDSLLDRREAAGRLTARTRRPFLVDLVDLICDHPAASGIMAYDHGVRFHLAEQLQIDQRAQRFAAIVTVAQDDDYAVVRALAAVGAILRPVYSSSDLIDLDDPGVRRTIVDCAMGVFSTAPSSPARGTGPSSAGEVLAPG